VADAEASAWAAVPVALPSAGGLRAFEAGGERLLLCNVDGAAHVIENRCPHAAVPLDSGALRGSVLECPFHGGKLDVRDGKPVAPPIRRPARTFPVRTSEGAIEVGFPDPS